MFCSKCGKPVKDNGKFCEFCGSRITVFTEAAVESEPQVLTDNVADSTADIQPEIPVEVNPKNEVVSVSNHGKSKRKLIIISSVCAAAVSFAVVIAVAFWGYIENFFVKTFSSPEQYYHYVEEKNVQDISNALGSALGSFKSAVDTDKDVGVTSEITLQLGDIIIDALAKEAGIDKSQISWASNVGISSDSSSKDGVSSMDIAFLLNNKSIINIELVYSLEDTSYYLRFPDLNEKYLLVEMPDAMHNADLDKLYAALPDEDTVAEIINRYCTIVLNTVDNVRQKSVKAEANGVTQSCVELTVTVDETTVKKVLEAVLTELKNDEEIKNIIKEVWLAVDVDEDNFDEFYEEFLDEIDSTIDSLDRLETELNDFGFDMITWVDGKGEIIGRKFEIDGLDGDIYYLSAYDGTDVGIEAACVIEDKGFEVLGTCGYEYGAMSGKIEIFGIGISREDKMPLVNIFIDDYEVDLFGDNKLNGTFTITMSDEFSDMIADEVGNSKIADYLKNGKIKLSVATADKTSRFEISVLYDSKLVVSLLFNFKETDEENITIPENAIDISDDGEFADYCDEISFDKLKSNLIDAGVPKELVDLIFKRLGIEDNNSDVVAVSADYYDYTYEY